MIYLVPKLAPSIPIPDSKAPMIQTGLFNNFHIINNLTQERFVLSLYV